MRFQAGGQGRLVSVTSWLLLYDKFNLRSSHGSHVLQVYLHQVICLMILPTFLLFSSLCSREVYYYFYYCGCCYCHRRNYRSDNCLFFLPHFISIFFLLYFLFLHSKTSTHGERYFLGLDCKLLLYIRL